MTAEQLQHARASAWRQDGHALLTGDEAADWLRSASLALFLPRPAQIAAPAGSFVEATLGEANAAPSLHAIEAASALLRRMLATASGAADAVALRLLDGPGGLLGGPGGQPDFLATEETLPFVFALRGDREWRRGPRGKSSPLVAEVWKLLDRDGAHTAGELKDKLGRHLTESAALRALTELWTTLRIEPIYSSGSTGDGEATHWQLLEANHERAMTAGSAMAQGMALSALVSVYLQSAVAATGEEIEAFLSPLASRSRVRDAVRGLHATRQLSVQHLGANEHFFVEGSLPDLGEAPARGLADMLPETPEALAVAAGEGDESRAAEAAGGLRIDALSEAETERERAVGDGRKRFVAERAAGSADRKGFGPARGGSTGFSGPRRTFGGTGEGARKSFGAPGGSFSKRAPSGPNAGPRPASRPASRSGARPAAGADSRPGKPAGQPFFAREPWKEDRRPGPGPDRQDRQDRQDRPVSSGSESREEFRGKPRAERPAASAGGERRPFAAPSFRENRENRESREDGSRKPFAPRGAGPGRAAPDGTAGGARPPRKTFAPRGDASGPARKPFTPRGDGDRPYPSSYPPRERDRKPFAAREGGRPGSSGSDRKPFAPREGGKPFTPRDDRRPFAPQAGGRPSPGGDRKPFTPRDDRKAFAPQEGGAGGRKPYAPREGGRPFSPRDDRKPFAPREGGAPGRRTFGPRPGAPDGAGERGGFAPRDRAAGPRQNGPRQDGPRQDSPRRFGAEGSAPPRRFAAGEGRPARPGAPAARPGGKRPRTAPFTSSGKPRTGVSETGRPGPRSESRSGPGAGPRAGRPGKPASGRKPGAPPRKPGGKGPGKGPGAGPNRGPRHDG